MHIPSIVSLPAFFSNFPHNSVKIYDSFDRPRTTNRLIRQYPKTTKPPLNPFTSLSHARTIMIITQNNP